MNGYWFVKKLSLKNMKIYKTKNQGHIFLPYLRDEDEMENKKEPKLSGDKQLFMCIGTGF